MPRIADLLNVRLVVATDEPTEQTVLPPAEQFPQQVNLVFEPVPATAQNHGPTMARPTTKKERESEQVVGRHTQQGQGCGGDKDHGRKSGGGFGSVKQRGGGLSVYNLLVRLLLVVVCGWGGWRVLTNCPTGTVRIRPLVTQEHCDERCPIGLLGGH